MRQVYTYIFLCISVASFAQTEVELAGFQLNEFPFFHRPATFNMDQDVLFTIDAQLHPAANGVTAEVFVVNDKSAAQWISDPALNDITAFGEQSFSFTAANVQANTNLLCSAGELSALPFSGIGLGYDVVIDVDGNGQLSAPDFIDGFNDAGFFVVHNITQPGQFEVSTQDWTDEEELTKRIWYPSNISDFATLPLVVISHGWTHEYTYYDYLGEHIASYGYIVMSHWNDVGTGNPAATNTSSLSLIANIDHLLAFQSTLFSGVLNGKIDHHHMAWTGHSTGGETPVRAYTRLRNGENTSAQFAWEDVSVISSICPVAWFSAEFTNPMDVSYHQFLGGADTDASGFAADGYYQPLTIFERATGNRQLTYLHGAGHEVFHGFDSSEEWPDSLASGPNLISKAQVHPVVKSYFLALCELYVKENGAAKDFFTRSYSTFHPMGIDDAVVISNEYRDGYFTEKLVMDDFESMPETQTSSAGFSIDWGNTSPTEIIMQDVNNSFGYDPGQPSNGMTRARFDDDPNSEVFSWEGNDVVRYGTGDINFGLYDYFSFRACQLTRHPYNVTINGPITFSVELKDQDNTTSVINIAPYGTITQTYQRDEGGELHLCLPDGDYTVEVAGTLFPSETFFEIPGYIDYSTTGSYEFTIASGEPCTDVDVFMYDEYGDGWDNGYLILFNSLGDTVGYGSLFGGTGPVPGVGWQNEFCTIRIPIHDFLTNGSNIDLGHIQHFAFLFGDDEGAATGALGIDDIELVTKELNISTEVQEFPVAASLEFYLYPNPASEAVNLVFSQNPQTIPMNTMIEIVDLSGKTVLRRELKNETFIRLPVHEIAEGFYFMRIANSEFSSTQTFVIVR